MPEQHALLLDDPWQVDAGDFPDAEGDTAKLLFLTNYGVLAPSILNVQPWRIRIPAGSMEFFADRTRVLPVVDPEGRELAISCGAALLNLRVAARAFGYDLEVEILPDANAPDLLARARLVAGAQASDADRRLRDSILTRRTHRAEFADRMPEQISLQDMAQAAGQEGATLTFVDGAEDKRRVAELVAEAERLHLADHRFRRELADWIRQRVAEGHGPPHETSWGLAGAAGYTPPPGGGTDFFTQRAANVARRFASPDDAAKRQYALAEGSPVLALLATKDDDTAGWLAAGQGLQRALLTGAATGLSASYLNPPIERAQLRRQLEPIFGGGGHSQVLLRLGYGRTTPPAARRPVRDVVEWEESR